MTFARRNKYAMQEAIRAVGMRAVKQQLCHSEEDCRAFLKTIVHPTTGRLKCVVKPNESAGTDSVFLCTTVDEVLAGFRLINGHCNGLGHENFGALCQVMRPRRQIQRSESLRTILECLACSAHLTDADDL
jgi:hypothetical protein